MGAIGSCSKCPKGKEEESKDFSKVNYSSYTGVKMIKIDVG